MFKGIKLAFMGVSCILLILHVFKIQLGMVDDGPIVFAMIFSMVSVVLEIIEKLVDKSTFL